MKYVVGPLSDYTDKMVHPFFERKERKKSNENALCGAYLNHH